jgi:hypothetical protein
MRKVTTKYLIYLTPGSILWLWYMALFVGSHILSP